MISVIVSASLTVREIFRAGDRKSGYSDPIIPNVRVIAIRQKVRWG